MSIIDVLPVGKENAIPAGDLAEALGIDERLLRKTVERERRNGELILSCSGEHGGYYRHKDMGELIEFYNHMKHRAETTLACIEAVRAAIEEGDE